MSSKLGDYIIIKTPTGETVSGTITLVQDSVEKAIFQALFVFLKDNPGKAWADFPGYKIALVSVRIGKEDDNKDAGRIGGES